VIGRVRPRAQNQGLAGIGGQDEENGFAQVVVDGAAFLDGLHQGGEVVVG
jgi:hypothetical protein